MGHKWRPSASQRREFARNMQNPDFASAYHERQRQRSEKRISESKFNYSSAGGNYVPTKEQHDAAIRASLSCKLTEEQKNACEMVMYGFSCNEKIHHDYIHIINELIRNNNLNK